MTTVDEPGQVLSARAPDPELLARYVPVVYHLVGRSVSRPAEVDALTQEILLRVAQEVLSRNDSQVVRIAVQRISAHFEDPGTVDGGEPGSFEELAVDWLELEGQERDLVRAGRWLDTEHRLLLGLWWEECAGRISRSDIAAALELGEARTAVSLQRMREQLEQCRLAEAALEREPLCPTLSSVASGWDGVPNARWRRRITEHVRTCVVCLRESEDQVPALRLIADLPMLPLPPVLVAALVEKGLLAAETVVDEPTSTIDREDEPTRPRGLWAVVRRAGSALAVVFVVMLLLFTGGLLYDVSQTRPTEPTGQCSGMSQPNGTVLDQQTCLTWQREPSSQKLTLNEAQEYCSELTLAGGNWTLPTREQLSSVIETFPGTTVDQTGEFTVRCVR